MGFQQLSALYEEVVERIIDSLQRGNKASIREELERLYPSELALVLEALPHDDRAEVWALVDTGIQGEVLHHLRDIARASLIEDLGKASLVASGEQMDVDELAEVVPYLPEEVAQAVIESLDEDERRRFDSHFLYAKNTAGRMMDTDVRMVRPDISLRTARRYLRRFGVPTGTNSVLVMDREGKYLGKLFFADLATGYPEQRVSEIMDPEAVAIRADTEAREIAMLFEQRDLLSVAVVDEYNKLLGQIAVSEVLDVIRDEADRTLMNMAGLEEEEDLFAPVLPRHE